MGAGVAVGAGVGLGVGERRSRDGPADLLSGLQDCVQCAPSLRELGFFFSFVLDSTALVLVSFPATAVPWYLISVPARERNIA